LLSGDILQFKWYNVYYRKTCFPFLDVVSLSYFVGKALVHDLLHDFLFPASKTMMDSMNGGTTDLLLSELNPKYEIC
jgi:hypothetical protein